MRLVYWDTETHPIQPGQIFPQLVCVSWCDDQTLPQLLDRAHGRAEFTSWIKDPDVHLVGHNIAYDMGIMAAEDPTLLRPIWEAYRAGRVHCTEMRQRLLDIAAGVFKWDEDPITGEPVKNSYGLGDIMTRITGGFHKKAKGHDAEATWRLNYHLLSDVPLKDWQTWAQTVVIRGVPVTLVAQDAWDYACKDAADTRTVFHHQDASARHEGAPSAAGAPPVGWPGPMALIPDAERQTESSWVLHLKAGHGVRTDGEPVRKLKAFLETERAASMVHLRASGIIKQAKKKGVMTDVRDMKKIEALVFDSFTNRGEPVPLTKGGKTGDKKKPRTDEETLLASGDPNLTILAQAMGGMKLLNTYIPILERGTRYPITSRPNALVDTGRTSWSKPNLQNPPRKGGVRECFIPRPGFVFCSVDFDTIELRALAQRCLEWVTWSVMADCLIRGEDLHLALAAEMLGISYADCVARYALGDKLVEDTRQDAKMANFGFPGGMGVRKFLATQAETVKKKLKADPNFNPMEWGTKLRNAWMAKFREMKPYFAKINGITGDDGPKRVVHEWSNRVRGGLDYCSAANGEFQGRTADGAKLADRLVSWECYLGTGPLLGCRPVMFLHDEVITEMPEAIAHEAAHQKAEIMLDAMRQVIPNIPITAKPTLFRRWYKGAKPVMVDGRLVPSMPHKDAKGNVTWVADLPGTVGTILTTDAEI